MHLFDKIHKDESLLDINPLFRTFYESRLNSNIGKFIAVKDRIDSSAKWESVFETNYILNTGLITLYTDSIRYNDSLMEADPYNPSYNNWQTAVKNYNSSIRDLMDYNDSLMSIMNGILLGKQDDIKESNDSINPEGVYELNDQIINGIYLTTVARGNYEFTKESRTPLK